MKEIKGILFLRFHERTDDRVHKNECTELCSFYGHCDVGEKLGSAREGYEGRQTWSTQKGNKFNKIRRKL